ncbi:methyltransferase family protein [Sulfurimonas marina]|uniref:NnrU domain-containing protein n=1 Tax=Sulfurimonas marina TaxID=2590551 RepID=A0A7M1AXB8_9BACT|nr:NnrU family protein [Sulfurimonas marina]QOP42074.1 hypothetical protein FJR03_10130 [Sulfurimonas marina]
MKRYLLFGFSIFSYLFSIATLSLLILWVYPWGFLPHYIDIGIDASVWYAVMFDVGLLLLFGLQHSLMARDFFKEKILAKFPHSFQTSLYGVASAICLYLLIYFWHPIDTLIWDFNDGFFFWFLTAIYLFGWFFAFISTFLIDHFELFGLHQGYRVFKSIPEPESCFQTKFFYKYVRHPVQLGTLIGLWATPSMSFGHLLMSIGFTVYAVIGLYLEEKSLVKTFGNEYRDYQEKVPFLIPFTKPHS